MISLETDICRLLGIANPIIQAGMAGGPTTASLVAAVSEAGGLGSLGAAYMPPEVLRETVKEIRKQTQKPFAVNIFAENAKDDFGRAEEVQEALNAFRRELGIEEAAGPFSSPDWSRAQFEVCLAEGVPVISTAFGSLPAEGMVAAKQQGVKIVTMVTTVQEALEAERNGADAIVAQGSEAGGHRSTFSLDSHPDGAQVGLMSLLPQIVDAVDIPVIAAGGIADGRGLAASLVLGAAGVQIGTRFLCAVESAAHPAHKRAIFESDEESTVITKNFSGRPARGIKNRFISEFDETGCQPLPFPSQNTITKDIRAAAAKQGDAQFMSLWAGQSTRMLREEESAADIVRTIMEEARRICR